jgi:hypothetical protein
MKILKKHFLIFFIIGMLVLINIQPVIVCDENNPEINDDRNDTFKYWDIIKGWFQENHLRMELFCITIMVHELSPMFSSVCLVYWECKNIKYQVQVNITSFRVPKFSAKIFDTQWKNYKITGNCNYEDNTITFKFPKNEIGFLSQGDKLTNITANLFHPYCYFLNDNSLIYPLLNDEAHGRDYKIQY